METQSAQQLKLTSHLLVLQFLHAYLISGAGCGLWALEAGTPGCAAFWTCP